MPRAEIAAALLGLLSFQRSAEWADELSLWSAAVREGPLMPRSQLYLGLAHKDAGDREAARISFEAARILAPGDWDMVARATCNLGALLLQSGDVYRARLWFQESLATDPGNVEALVNMGVACVVGAQRYGERQLLPEAMGYIRRALQISPNYAQAWANAGVVAAELGHTEEARQFYEQSLWLNPSDRQTRANLEALP